MLFLHFSQSALLESLPHAVITVGFNQTSHTVIEGGEVTVCVHIMQAKNTSFEVTFNLVVETERGTACKYKPISLLVFALFECFCKVLYCFP